MSLHHLWLDFLNAIAKMIDLNSCVSIAPYLDKMPDVLQIPPYTFLHVPNQSLSNMHIPWTWDFFGAHIQKPNQCLC
jgi:hypothetical protein